jgi:cupin superfamily acireductone dioxygenase involved in methionine salvage
VEEVEPPESDVFGFVGDHADDLADAFLVKKLHAKSDLMRAFFWHGSGAFQIDNSDEIGWQILQKQGEFFGVPLGFGPDGHRR